MKSAPTWTRTRHQRIMRLTFWGRRFEVIRKRRPVFVHRFHRCPRFPCSCVRFAYLSGATSEHTAVARDAKRNDIASTRFDADWPNPVRSTAAIAPIAALQSESAAISKDGEFRSSGQLAREIDEPLDPEASVTLASVVCRGPNVKAPIVVERWIEGGRCALPRTPAANDRPPRVHRGAGRSGRCEAAQSSKPLPVVSTQRCVLCCCDHRI